MLINYICFFHFWQGQINTNANGQFSYGNKSLRTLSLQVNKMKTADFKNFRYLNPLQVQCYETLDNVHSLLNYYFIK